MLSRHRSVENHTHSPKQQGADIPEVGEGLLVDEPELQRQGRGSQCEHPSSSPSICAASAVVSCLILVQLGLSWLFPSSGLRFVISLY